MKQQVNVTKIIPSTEIKEGQKYYFMDGNKIKQGTAVSCDKCGKWCSVNAHTVISFGKATTNISIAELSDDELSYNEDCHQSLCYDCDYDPEAGQDC